MLTNRQLLVITLALIESFALSAHYAVFMPFYPNVAKDKGNTSFQVGSFFAVGSVVGLLGSLVAGWLLKRGVPPKSMVIFGLLLSGATLAAHGFYKDYFMSGYDFFYANVITRIIHSIGPVAATTAIYPIVAVEMGEKRGIYLPLIEAAYNMGLMIWPSIGALMFDNLGYVFPFVSVGFSAIVIGLLLAVLLPHTAKPDSTDASQEKVGFDKIDFGLTLILQNISLCYLIIGFNDITLSIELKNLHLTHTQIGYCFAVATVCYGSCIYFWGFFCHTPTGRYITLMFGYMFTIVGLSLEGPCEFVGLRATLAVRLLGQGLMGTGLAALFTVSMIAGMHYLTHSLKLPDDVATHGFFSGLIFFSLCLGYLIGHAGFAGVVIDLLGYNLAVTSIIGAVLWAALLHNSALIGRLCLRKPKSGYEPINGGSFRQCNA